VALRKTSVSGHDSAPNGTMPDNPDLGRRRYLARRHGTECARPDQGGEDQNESRLEGPET